MSLVHHCCYNACSVDLSLILIVQGRNRPSTKDLMFEHLCPTHQQQPESDSHPVPSTMIFCSRSADCLCVPKPGRISSSGVCGAFPHHFPPETGTTTEKLERHLILSLGVGWVSGSGGPKTVVEKTPVDKQEKRGKKHSEHPANFKPRTEQDLALPRRSCPAGRKRKKGTREEGAREGVQARNRNEEGRRVKGGDVGRSSGHKSCDPLCPLESPRAPDN